MGLKNDVPLSKMPVTTTLLGSEEVDKSYTRMLLSMLIYMQGFRIFQFPPKEWKWIEKYSVYSALTLDGTWQRGILLDDRWY